MKAQDKLVIIEGRIASNERNKYNSYLIIEEMLAMGQTKNPQYKIHKQTEADLEKALQFDYAEKEKIEAEIKAEQQ